MSDVLSWWWWKYSFSLNQFTSRKVCLILFYLIVTGFDILLAITCTKWEFLLMTIISNMFGWHSANFEVEKCSLRRFCTKSGPYGEGMVVKRESYAAAIDPIVTLNLLRGFQSWVLLCHYLETLAKSFKHFPDSVFASIKLRAVKSYIFTCWKLMQYCFSNLGNFWRQSTEELVMLTLPLLVREKH